MAHQRQNTPIPGSVKLVTIIIALVLGGMFWSSCAKTGTETANAPAETSTSKLRAPLAPGLGKVTLASISPDGEYVLYVGSEPTQELLQYVEVTKLENGFDAATSVVTLCMRNDDGQYRVADLRTFFTPDAYNRPVSVTHAWMGDNGYFMCRTSDAQMIYSFVGGEGHEYADTTYSQLDEFVGFMRGTEPWFAYRYGNKVRVHPFRDSHGGSHAASGTEPCVDIDVAQGEHGTWIASTFPHSVQVGKFTTEELTMVTEITNTVETNSTAAVSADGQVLAIATTSKTRKVTNVWQHTRKNQRWEITGHVGKLADNGTLTHLALSAKGDVLAYVLDTGLTEAWQHMDSSGLRQADMRLPEIKPILELAIESPTNTVIQVIPDDIVRTPVH